MRPGTSRNSKEVSAHRIGKQLSNGSIFNALQSASHCICHIRFQRFACSDVLRIYVFRYVVNLFSFGKILLFFLSNVSILVTCSLMPLIGGRAGSMASCQGMLYHYAKWEVRISCMFVQADLCSSVS